MGVWDVPPSELCTKHLLGEQSELHGLWKILTQGKKGYRHHLETKRWVGKLAALYSRHKLLVAEMAHRRFTHHSPPDKSQATGYSVQKSSFIPSNNSGSC